MSTNLMYYERGLIIIILYNFRLKVLLLFEFLQNSL